MSYKFESGTKSLGAFINKYRVTVTVTVILDAALFTKYRVIVTVTVTLAAALFTKYTVTVTLPTFHKTPLVLAASISKYTVTVTVTPFAALIIILKLLYIFSVDFCREESLNMCHLTDFIKISQSFLNTARLHALEARKG